MKLVKMPNVTGYLIGGLIVGPSVLNLVHADALSQLGFISSVALGFIAFSIGSEFKASYFKRVGMTPIVIAILEAMVAVAGHCSLIAFGFDPAFSFVLGAIAAATAPAATIMVIRQYRAKGPVTETLLSVVALDDAVALIGFGIAVAIAQMIENPGSGNLMMQLMDPVIEILGSLGSGAVLGFVLLIPLKFFHDEDNRQALIYAFIFIALFVSSTFGFSDLLTCMAMGAVFANISNESDKVMTIADRLTPPIFMAFFVLSGAGSEAEHSAFDRLGRHHLRRHARGRQVLGRLGGREDHARQRTGAEVSGLGVIAAGRCRDWSDRCRADCRAAVRGNCAGSCPVRYPDL